MQVIRDSLDAAWTGSEQSAVVVLGNFDGIHRGHRMLLEEADKLSREENQSLRRRVVTFSPHPKQAMGQPDFRLIYNERQKAELMEETGWVDELIFLAFQKQLQTMPPEEFFTTILQGRYHARAVVVGDNFHFGWKGMGDSALLQKLCNQHGIRCRVMPRMQMEGEAVSSSRIRVLLEQGEIGEAGRLLGRPYFVEGQVRHGKQLGRKRQTPTINLPMREERLVPKKGVYVSRTFTEKGCFSSISNVGHNPTVGGESLRTETHILDFSGDLYGQTVRVELLKFLRPERRFESVDALYAQLKTDIAHTKEYFQTESAKAERGENHEEI